MSSFQSNGPVANSSYALSTGVALSDPFITVFMDRDPTPYDFNYPIKKRWINLTLVKEWILVSFTNVTGQSLANWVLLSISGLNLLQTLSDNVNPPGGTVVLPSLSSDSPPNNIQFTGQLNENGASSPSPFQTIIENPGNHSISINPMSPARWIVDPLGGLDPLRPNGTHTTIVSAVASAVSGDTILIMPGNYVEDVVLKPGVNLTAYTGDSFNKTVLISGLLLLNQVGTVNISNICLQTNGNFCLAVTTLGTSTLNCTNCRIIGVANGCMLFTSTSSSSLSVFNSCTGDMLSSGHKYFEQTGNGSIVFNSCSIANSAVSSTPSTLSAGVLNVVRSTINFPIAVSSTASTSITSSGFNNAGSNTACLALTGSGTSGAFNSQFISGSSSAITIDAGTTFSPIACDINSSNTNAITGLGTITYSGLTFSGSSTTINVTTQVFSGTLQGSKNTAPAAGFLGELITSGSVINVSVSTGTPKSVTSILLTPGVWDVTGFSQCAFSGFVGSSFIISLSTVDNTLQGNGGDQRWNCGNTTADYVSASGCVPAFRVVISSSTTYYLVVQANFLAGTGTAAGRISGVRVG